MNCDQIQKLLSAYLDRQLSGSEQAEARAHLGRCEMCAQELRSLLQIKHLLRRYPQPELPAGLIERIERQTVFEHASENGGMAMRWLIPSLAFAIAGAWATIHFYSTRTPMIHPSALEAKAPLKNSTNGDMLAWHSTAPFSTSTQ